MKRLFAILIMVLGIIQAQAKEAYGVIVDGTLTFYYDDLKSSREGVVFKHSEMKKDVIKVVIDSSMKEYKPTNLANFFSEMENLTKIDGLDNLITSNVTDMSWMFYGCHSLTSLDLSKFNTSNVTSMCCMFQHCDALTSLDVSNFDTFNVKEMSGMFFSCESLTTLNLSNFNTSNVIRMYDMFGYCRKLFTLDLSNFNTDNVTDISNMFRNCTSLRTIYVSNQWNTEKIESEKGKSVFSKCTQLVGGQGTKYDASHTDYTYAHIDGGTANPGYFIDKAQAKGEMYVVVNDDVATLYYDTNISNREGTVHPIGEGARKLFDEIEEISKVVIDNSFADARPTSTAFWFDGAEKLQGIDGIENLNTSNVTNMWCMFQSCKNLKELVLSTFDTSNVTNMRSMFNGCWGLTSLVVNNFNTSNVTDMYSMFANCSVLTQLDLNNFNTDNVTNMCAMFNGCKKLISLHINKFNTSKVTDMWAMFANCESLTSLDVTNFNTSNVTNMGNMFSECDVLASLDVSSFNIANGTYMRGMFHGCDNLESIKLGNGFTQFADDMFKKCPNIKTIHSYIETPFAFAESVFESEVYNNATVTVPKGTLANYKATDGWKKFINLKERNGNQDLEPTGEGNTDFGNVGDINNSTDLNGNIIGNIYYSIGDENGEYSSTEGCIILRKPSTDDSMEGTDLFGEDLKSNFTGIIFMVKAGSGTIKVKAESVGGMALKVKIGNNAPFAMELEGKMNVTIPYSVTEPTYVYNYGGEMTVNARGLRASSYDNALKIYGIEWNNTQSGIETPIISDSVNSVIYNLQGQRMQTVTKGINIIKGKKVILK